MSCLRNLTPQWFKTIYIPNNFKSLFTFKIKIEYSISIEYSLKIKYLLFSMSRIVNLNRYNYSTVNPLYWDSCIKTQVGNRCTIKHAFSHIFIRFQVGFTVQYIDILKSYFNPFNLNKYMAKKCVLWFIYIQLLGF